MFDKLSISIYNETLLSLMFDKLSETLLVYIMSIYKTLLSLMFDKLSIVYIMRQLSISIYNETLLRHF